MNFIKVKDKLVLLMLVCVASNFIIAIFSLDYLRKMEWNAEQLYNEKMQIIDVLKSAETLTILNELDKAETLLNNAPYLAFDSKMDFFLKQLNTKPSATLIEEMKEYVMTRTEQQLAMYEKDIHKGYIAIITVSVFMVLVVVFLSYVATKSVRKPTKQLNYLLHRAQQGDFSHMAKYESRDELGELLLSYNQMVSEVKALFEVVQNSARAVNIANEQLAGSAEMMTSSAHQITNNTEIMTAAVSKSTVHVNSNTAMIQEVASSIDMITNRIQQMKEMIEQMVDQAQSGEQHVAMNVTQMQSIEQAMLEANDMMKRLEKQTEQISTVIDMIQAIANDTNLLALNASIEAARAGENGKGFGVVANEVKKLAGQSLHSTQKITNIVEVIQHEAKAAVSVMENASNAVRLGIATTNQTSQNFRNIASRIQQVGPYMEEVSVTIEQIDYFTKDVARQSIELAQMTEENVVQIEQISTKTTEQLAATTEIESQIQNITKNTRALTHALHKFVV